MKIIKDKNNVVVFAGDDLDLTGKGLIGKNFTAPFCTTKDFTAELVDNIPDGYAGGHYTFDGKWEKSVFGVQEEQKRLDIIAADQAKIDAELAKIQAVEKAKEDIVTAKAGIDTKSLSAVELVFHKRLTAIEKILGV